MPDAGAAALLQYLDTIMAWNIGGGWNSGVRCDAVQSTTDSDPDKKKVINIYYDTSKNRLIIEYEDE